MTCRQLHIAGVGGGYLRLLPLSSITNFIAMGIASVYLFPPFFFLLFTETISFGVLFLLLWRMAALPRF